MNPFTKIASIIFGLMALAHLYRLANHFPLSVGGHEMPLAVNVAGFIIAALLCWGLWRESNLKKV
jgi:hypothetical protein